MTDRDRFLFPNHRYHGEFTPENLMFNANLQEFSQRISYICSLETGGKISPDHAYQQIKALWQQLQASQQNLGIGDSDSSEDGNSSTP